MIMSQDLPTIQQGLRWDLTQEKEQNPKKGKGTN